MLAIIYTLGFLILPITGAFIWLFTKDINYFLLVSIIPCLISLLILKRDINKSRNTLQNHVQNDSRCRELLLLGENYSECKDYLFEIPTESNKYVFFKGLICLYSDGVLTPKSLTRDAIPLIVEEVKRPLITTAPENRSVVGDAIIGGAIAGPTGAIVGAIHAADKNANGKEKAVINYISKYVVRVYGEEFHHVAISDEYKNGITIPSKLYSIFDYKTEAEQFIESLEKLYNSASENVTYDF